LKHNCSDYSSPLPACQPYPPTGGAGWGRGASLPAVGFRRQGVREDIPLPVVGVITAPPTSQTQSFDHPHQSAPIDAKLDHNFPMARLIFNILLPRPDLSGRGYKHKTPPGFRVPHSN